MRFQCFMLFVFVGWVSGGVVQAQDIRITGAGEDVRVAVSLDGLQGRGDRGVREFLGQLEEDLNRWGWFVVAPANQASVLLRGEVRGGAGQMDVQVEASQPVTGRVYLRERYRGDAGDAAMLAHRVSDALVAAIHGAKGVASTRIAFAGALAGKKDLFVIGASGREFLQLTRDGVPCFSPAWSPDAGTIFYTSFVRRFPDLYRVDLGSYRRSVVSQSPGMNAGAAVSPDGRLLALVLSRDGNPEVYTLHLDSGRLTRVTRTPHAAEASPSWSPDGRRLAYVSDGAGSPQIWMTGVSGGQARRLTFRGRENVSPDWGPDGRLVYSSRRGGNYQLVVMDPDVGQETVLTTEPVNHESPSWARDGRHLVFSRESGRRSDLYILDTLLGTQIRLTTLAGDWYFPAWSAR